MDNRNVSSATEMAKLADLFYESNRDGNTKIDARRNFNSRGVSAVSGDRKTEWVAQKLVATQIRCFRC